jgi:hypothetical protein
VKIYWLATWTVIAHHKPGYAAAQKEEEWSHPNLNMEMGF